MDSWKISDSWFEPPADEFFEDIDEDEEYEKWVEAQLDNEEYEQNN